MKVHNKPIKDMSDAELFEEYKYWDDKVINAKSWGAALAAASEFRTSIEREINQRNLKVVT